MRILGIDPGLSGAFVLLENGTPIEWGLMPVMVEGSNKRINASALASQWRFANIDIAVLFTGAARVGLFDNAPLTLTADMAAEVAGKEAGLGPNQIAAFARNVCARLMGAAARRVWNGPYSVSAYPSGQVRSTLNCTLRLSARPDRVRLDATGANSLWGA